MKVIVQNKKALHDYEIIESIEAGIVLNGDEVKSLRAGRVSLVGSFANVFRNELYLNNCNITPYAQAYQKRDEDAMRPRKLLLHRRQLDKLIGDISRKGITLVAIKLYFNERSKIKVDLAVAKHRKAEGKKQMLKERDIRRETDREIKGRS